ncbi:sugar ABC transporter ATP-binding protein [Paenibacillus sp. P25]|nr:sugar ABC transporter ATP-binding protein [Paenibacillus sp. P25]
MIKILAGVLGPDPGGRFEIAGNPVELNSAMDAIRRGISVNYQDLSLFPNLSVAENIVIGHVAGGKYRVNWSEVRQTAKQALERLGVELDLQSPLESLSIAKQRLVSIARAISFQAKLIVLDEPTSSLSAGEVELLFRIIRELRSSGVSILFVSHKLDELFAISDRFTVLRDGKFIGRYDKAELDEAKLISLMVGRTVEYERHNARPPAGSPMVLEVKDLSKKGHFHNIALSVCAGEIVGITGLVGAGRTELAHALFGLQEADSGEIRLNGRRVKLRSTQDALRHGIAYVPESRQLQGLVLPQTIARNISLAVLPKLTNRVRLIRPRKERELAEQYMSKLDVRPKAPDMPVSQLSGGNQQKVVIAKWLASPARDY